MVANNITKYISGRFIHGYSKVLGFLRAIFNQWYESINSLIATRDVNRRGTIAQLLEQFKSTWEESSRRMGQAD